MENLSDDITHVKRKASLRPSESLALLAKRVASVAKQPQPQKAPRIPPKQKPPKRARPKRTPQSKGMTKAQKVRHAGYMRRLRAAKWAEYRANNLVSMHRCRARRAGASGSFTKAEWIALCAKYDDHCVRCKQVKRLTVDHIVPFEDGGTNDISNIQPLCGSCNSIKARKHTDYRS